MSKMSDLTIPRNTSIAIVDDGWETAAAEAEERGVNGTILKFVDGRWSAGKEEIEDGKGPQLAALETREAWLPWRDGKPGKPIFREPGKPLPKRSELGDMDRAEWEPGFDGQPRDPWVETRYVSLIDPLTAQLFTFPTHTVGGGIAIDQLADQIKRMRSVHPGAVPLVELGSAKFPTGYGDRLRPAFNIVGWRGGRSTHGLKQPIEPPITREELSDDIPF
jgi:hypothetical protein